MNRRLFFLKQEGWFEVEITGKLLQAKDDELARWAYEMMDQYGYRNYWISENPGAVIASPVNGTKQSVSTGSVFPRLTPNVTPFRPDRLLRQQYTCYKTELSNTPPRNDAMPASSQ